MKKWHTNHQAKTTGILPNIMLRAILVTTLFGLSVPLNAATYKLTFTGLWNDSHVQNSLPGGAHFTTLIGATHQPGQPLWSPGTLASKGIENVAETGDISELANEIDAAIGAGTAQNQVTTSGLFSFPSSISTNFDIFDSHSSVSFVSMVAPSPDWFVGIYDVSLKSGATWIDSLSLDLVPWDAGTEDGSDFSLNNPATNPQQLITAISGTPFVDAPVIGSLTFELVAIPLPGAALLFLTGFSALLGCRFMRKL